MTMDYNRERSKEAQELINSYNYDLNLEEAQELIEESLNLYINGLEEEDNYWREEDHSEEFQRIRVAWALIKVNVTVYCVICSGGTLEPSIVKHYQLLPPQHIDKYNRMNGKPLMCSDFPIVVCEYCAEDIAEDIEESERWPR